MTKAAAIDREERLHSLREAAAILGISTRTLSGLIASGQLAVIRVSMRRLAIHPGDLSRYIAERRERAR